MKNIHPHTNKKVKILFYTMNWYPFEASLQPIYGSILRHLKQKGYSITILTSIPYFLNGREERWETYKWKFLIKEKWEDIPVLRSFVFSPYFLRHFKLLIRILSGLSFSLTSLLTALFSGRQELICTVSHPPLMIGITSFIISKIKRCPYVYCLEDIYPDILVELNVLKRDWFFIVLSKIELFIYNRAYKINVISNQMKLNLLEKGIEEHKIEVIPHFGDMEKIIPLERSNPIAKAYELYEKFVVLLPGSLSYRYDIDNIFETATLLKNEQDIKFVFINRGELRDVYRQKVKEQNMNNVCFVPFQPHDKFNQLLASADACLVSLNTQFSKYSVPSKVYTIMASARPIVAIVDAQSEVARIIERSDCGIIVTPSAPEALAQVLKNISLDKEKCRIMGKKGRRFAEIYLNKKDLCKKYEEVVEHATIA